MILVIGGEGQLGEAFHTKLESDDAEYIITAHRPRSKGILSLDITDLRTVQEVIEKLNPECVINCAAYTFVDEAEREFKKSLRVNAMGAHNIAIACRNVNSMLIHFSTDYVFNGEKRKAYTILDKPRPINKYGTSKAFGEKLVQGAHAYSCIIRTSWLFSKGHSNFVQKILDWSENNRELRIVEDQVSSPTYAFDLVDATFNIMRNRLTGLFHISNSGFCSRYEWAKYILSLIGWQGDIHPASSQDFHSAAKRPKFSVLDNSLTEEILGFVMPHWKDATKRFLINVGYML